MLLSIKTGHPISPIRKIMNISEINIHKAKVHNLKDVSLNIPKNSLVVITGPSGSGKSSLAFDTIYVEGQRRYIESLSSYARQFLGQFQPPEVESITGLSPAIAIDQKTTSRNPRSTVGTITEIFDYMRILYARVGTLYSPRDGREIRKWSPGQVARELQNLKQGSKIQIIADAGNFNKKEIKAHISHYLSLGLVKCILNDTPFELSAIQTSDLKANNNLKLILDRIVIKPNIESRITDSVEFAYKMGQGIVNVDVDSKKVLEFSEFNIDVKTKEVFPDLEPRLFSFNSPVGACAKCNGLGEFKNFNKNLMIEDSERSINDGAIKPLHKKNSFLLKMVQSIAEEENVDLDVRFKDLPKKFLKILFEGSDKEYTYSFTSENSHFEFKKSFPGIPQWLEKKFNESSSEKVKQDLLNFMDIQTCPACKGLRLNEIALATKVGPYNIMEVSSLSIDEAYKYFKSLELEGEKKIIAQKLFKEIVSRLQFLIDVGLNYLTLNRPANTLSGGEGQRIRLATQIGSALSGVLYVLDEPSIGLHQRDNTKLIKTLKNLRDLGNTVIVVEHDEETMLEADFLVDMGPGAGPNGGQIVSAGPLNLVLKNKNSITADYLNKKRMIEIPSERRKIKEYIEIKGASFNNIKKLNVKIPTGIMTCITGVSGSGKSTLVHKILVPALKNSISGISLGQFEEKYSSINIPKNITSVIELDQSPIGRTPHSNPATYTGIFDDIRNIFAQTQESQIRGYKPGRFSFNVKGGRCEDCEGNGVKKIEMHFLPDVFITCSECRGTRFNRETLTVLYKGKNISEILEMTILEASDFFKHHSKVGRVLDLMNDVGLGYMKLGQAATTLSGGEAQRLKLSRELSRRPRGECLYILDEPTTGLHFSDIKALLGAINKLVENGHSVVTIEHNLDVIKVSDYVIDLGPEGGENGGEIVALGTPEEVAKVKQSFTGTYLAKALKKK